MQIYETGSASYLFACLYASVQDSCAGSGSLLLEVQNHLSTKRVGHFYATEKNGSNYNLLRMNLLIVATDPS
ncbi:MAG: N-6 DNA methylase, partial [Ruminococcus sp.]|nr:N-6 DNA methylase [Ruminococcus sp.]